MPFDLTHLPFDNSYTKLPSHFFHRVKPQPLAHAQINAVNQPLCEALGIDPNALLSAKAAEQMMNPAELLGCDPIAMKYTGHQFGHYNPDLGDGRGLLLGEIVTPENIRWDIHLKGAGKTPFSRFGDGRAVLRSSIREYLGSEAMHGLGIPTTRALCLISSSEFVQREKPEPAAMLVRVADSHIRFGHFEWLFHSQQQNDLKTLANYVIARHYPELEHSAHRFHDLFQAIVQRTAVLMAKWQLTGFAHGVMNTDNFSITGATFDFGPYAFLDRYDPAHICNHSDHSGRYAFNQQPSIGLWNLNALAYAFSSILPREALIASLNDYEPLFIQAFDNGMRHKLGLLTTQAEDTKLASDFLTLLAKNGCDYTQSFRKLSDELGAFMTALNAKNLDENTVGKFSLRDDFIDRESFDAWTKRYVSRLAQEGLNTPDDIAKHQSIMEKSNPVYVLRNYLAQTAISKAEGGDFSEVERLRQLLSQPYIRQSGMESYEAPPPAWGRDLVISCSS